MEKTNEYHTMQARKRKEHYITRTKGSKGLSRQMIELTLAQDELENATEPTVEKMVLYAKFEDISHEANTMLKEVEMMIVFQPIHQR